MTEPTPPRSGVTAPRCEAASPARPSQQIVYRAAGVERKRTARPLMRVGGRAVVVVAPGPFGHRIPQILRLAAAT